MIVRSAALVVVAVLAASCGTGVPAVEPLEQASASPLDAPADPSEEPAPTDPVESPVPDPAPQAVAGLGFESTPAANVSVPDALVPLLLSRDGSRLLVSGPDPDGVGCEESEPYALQRFELETTVVDAAVDPTLGLNGIVRGPGDAVLLVAGCEGFIGEVMAGRETPDGRFVELVDVPLPASDDAFAAVTGVTWAPDGTLRWAMVGASPELVATDLAGTETGARTALDVEVYELAATSSTTYGVDFSADVAVVDLLTGERFAGFERVVAAPDADAVVLAGDAGVAVVRAGAAPEPWIDDPADGVRWSAGPLVAEGFVVVVEDDGGEGVLHVATSAGVVETVDVGAFAFPPPMLSRTGARLVYSVRDPATDEVLFVLRDLA